MNDYKLANIKRREQTLTKQREEVIKLDPDRSLEKLLDNPQPATLIQSFPDPDLYFLMHTIGENDFIPALALASSDQWEYILDLDVWESDRILLSGMTRTLDLLFRADPARLMRWIVTEKPDFFEYYLLKHMEIVIREHDEPPPSDEDGYITFDDKFYFRFPDFLPDSGRAVEEEELENERKKASELILNMLEKVAEMDISVFHGILLETTSLLPAETEEEQFRLKNARLAEKGFYPVHEAVGIYQRTRPDSLRTKGSVQKLSPAGELVMPPQWPSVFLKGDNLFEKTLTLLDPAIATGLQSEFASLVNKIISADRIKVHRKEELEKIVRKACAYLSIGMELRETENPSDTVEKYYLEDLFRTGAGEAFKLKHRIEKWHKESFLKRAGLPLSFLKEQWVGVVGGLMLDRPAYFDNYREKVLFREFQTLGEIHETAREVEKIIETDRMIEALAPDFQTGADTYFNFETVLLTLWTKNRLELDRTLKPIPTDMFRPFFRALFERAGDSAIDRIKRDDFLFWIAEETGTTPDALAESFETVAEEMFDNLETEYGKVMTEDIDPRFMPHFLLTDS